MMADWQTGDGACRLYRGDCLEIVPQLDAGSITAVIADPPYGHAFDCDYTRFRGGRAPSHRYCGSGSCGVACRERGINYIGCEIDPAYFDVARERLAQGQLTLAA